MARFRLVLLTTAAIAGVSFQSLSDEQDYQIDYAPILSRGFAIADEPSILEQCHEGYSAFRIFKHAASSPIAMSRIEKLPSGTRATERIFENGRPPEVHKYDLSESEWGELLDLFKKSGFWLYEVDDSMWMPDSLTLWIEGCVDGEFRSISIYPERDDFMIKILDYMGLLEP